MALPPTTSTLTVNAAFLQEIKEVHGDLWRLLADIRQRAAHPSGASHQWPSVLALLEELRDQLALHFALEEAYGYFEDPVYVAPRLCEAAHALRSEHKKLYTQICQVVEHAAQLLAEPDEDRAARVLDRFLQFERRLQRHESAENDLILREYDDDLGVGD